MQLTIFKAVWQLTSSHAWSSMSVREGSSPTPPIDSRQSAVVTEGKWVGP
jgi:hypothetical protein